LEVKCDLHIDSMHAAPAASRPLLEGVKKAHTYLGKNLANLDNAEITANRNGSSRPTRHTL
jgi:hypothetical protein